jgi:hypothetical protein
VISVPDTASPHNTGLCSVPGCGKSVSKAGHALCYTHWRESQSKKQDGPSTAVSLTSTALGEHFSLTAQRINQVLSDLGWIEKQGKGWSASEQGIKLLAEVKKASNGTTYVVWPEAILKSRILQRAVDELSTPATLTPEVNEAAAAYGNAFRKKFPPTHRTTDGHRVRSKAEMLIDDWLYSIARQPHAYERRVPIDEDMYCDFYLPQGKVYVEYWGLENDPQYLARKNEKVALYRKYGLNLIELTDEHVKNLDDHFPRLLLKFGIRVD